jgi:hypothetical protein
MSATSNRSVPVQSHQQGDRYVDPVIEAYKKDVDRTLIVEMLKRTPEERLLTLQRVVEDAFELRKAMDAAGARATR